MPSNGFEESNRRFNKLESMIKVAAVSAAAEIDAAMFLRTSLKPQAYIPPAGGWAATYCSIAHLADMIMRGLVSGNTVELGGGVSTIWAGLAVREHGHGKILSVEHDPFYASRTAELVSRHNLENYVEIVVAPLSDVSIHGETYRWYSSEVWVEKLDSVGCLFIDGPPGISSRMARFPAVPILGQYLLEGAWILLDDIDREAEQEICDIWVQSGVDGRRLDFVEDIGRTRVMRVGS